jgi:hypothetical protein
MEIPQVEFLTEFPFIVFAQLHDFKFPLWVLRPAADVGKVQEMPPDQTLQQPCVKLIVRGKRIAGYLAERPQRMPIALNFGLNVHAGISRQFGIVLMNSSARGLRRVELEKAIKITVDEILEGLVSLRNLGRLARRLDARGRNRGDGWRLAGP